MGPFPREGRPFKKCAAKKIARRRGQLEVGLMLRAATRAERAQQNLCGSATARATCPGSHGVDQGSSADLPICTGVIARLWSGCVAVQRHSPGVAILPFVLGRFLRLHMLPYGTKDRPIYLWASRARAKPACDLIPFDVPNEGLRLMFVADDSAASGSGAFKRVGSYDVPSRST